MKTHDNILTTRYGGVIPIIEKLYSLGIPQLIDSTANEISPRAKQSKYKFSDLFLTWVSAAMCGAMRIDNVTSLKEQLEVIPGLNVPSHDTVGRLMKKLATPIVRHDNVSQRRVTPNEYDDNLPLNRLLIQATLASGALKKGQEYILDVDCTFIHTASINASALNKDKRQGFNPMICLIGNLPVFISMRNGNSVADYREAECIGTSLDFLKAEGITISHVRTDGAGYKEGLTKMLNDRGINFLTASPVNKTYKKMFNAFEESPWEKAIIETATEFKNCEVAEIEYSMTNLDEKWRIIAQRVPLNDSCSHEEKKRRREVDAKMKKLAAKKRLKSHQKRYAEGDWSAVVDYKYKMIATNDFDTPIVELIKTYNERGTAERQFSFMKQDFGWKYPPFMRMNENTVFFIITAIANNIFRAMAEKLNEHIDDIELNARVRRFQKAFINTVAICQDGHNWIFFSAKIDFEKIK